MPKKKRVTGATRMLELGHKGVKVWLPPGVAEVVERAAKRAKLPLATFVRVAAHAVASRERFSVTRYGVTDLGRDIPKKGA